jgi:hypothetical protein
MSVDSEQDGRSAMAKALPKVLNGAALFNP